MAMTVCNVQMSAGNSIPYLATGTILSKSVQLFGSNMVAVANEDAESGDKISALISGVCEMDAATGSGFSFAIGDQLYYDATNDRITNTASGNSKCGICLLAKTTAQATVTFLLNGLTSKAD